MACRDSAETRASEVYGDSGYADGRPCTSRPSGATICTPRCRRYATPGLFQAPVQHRPEAGTVTCPAGHAMPSASRDAAARPRQHLGCGDCPLRAACTTAGGGRMISIHPHEAELQPRNSPRTTDWQQAYRTHRPVVERKISHFTHRPWGGRKARCRGHARILTDILTRASAINLARLATLGLQLGAGGLGHRLEPDHPPPAAPAPDGTAPHSTTPLLAAANHTGNPIHRGHYISSVLGGDY